MTARNRVVLIQREIIRHYRVPIYNALSRALDDVGMALTVIGDDIETTNPHPVDFDLRLANKSSYRFIQQIRIVRPHVIVAFMSLKTPMVWWVLLIGKMAGVPVISWRHAIDLSRPNNVVRRLLYYLMSWVANQTLLYSVSELDYLPRTIHWKTHVANNTLDFSSVPTVDEAKDNLRRRYGVSETKVVLFVGRIQPRKKLKDLLSLFEHESFRHSALVVIGSGATRHLATRMARQPNVYPIGGLYDPVKKAELFTMADVFCIPGAVGLGIVEAFYWGLPIVTRRDECHGPEIGYLKDGVNGYLACGGLDFRKKLLELLQSDSIRAEMSANARKTYEREATVSCMINGFVSAIGAAVRSSYIPGSVRSDIEGI